MATMRDIAEAVGVSMTTVSNVVHGNLDRVSPQTVARIREAIEQMHYVPNMSARALVSNSSRIIAYVDTHSPQETYAGNGFAGVLLSGLEGVVTDHGYFLMMRRGTDEAVLKLMLNNWNPDGVIFKDCVPLSLVQFVRKLGKPCVTINTYFDAPDLIQVRADDRRGGRIATEHLLALGHREILFIGAVHRGFMNNDQRYLGHCDALRAAGIEPRASSRGRKTSSPACIPSARSAALHWAAAWHSRSGSAALRASASPATSTPRRCWPGCARAACACRRRFPSSALTTQISRACAIRR